MLQVYADTSIYLTDIHNAYDIKIELYSLSVSSAFALDIPFSTRIMYFAFAILWMKLAKSISRINGKHNT